MPMKLAHHTRLHAHRDACEGLGYWQLDHRGLFAVAAVNHTSLGFFQFEFERWKFLPRSHWVWNVILETIVAAFGTDGDAGREHESLLLSAALSANQNQGVINSALTILAATGKAVPGTCARCPYIATIIFGRVASTPSRTRAWSRRWRRCHSSPLTTGFVANALWHP